MKKQTWSFVAAVAVLLTACIPSLNPFYTDKDIVTDPRLLGEWQEPGEGDEAVDVWKFEEAKDRAYSLTVTDGKGKSGEFKAVLFKLGDHKLLDIIPTECEFAGDQNELVAASVFPGHLLIHVAQLDSELSMAFCDFDWLAKHLESNPKALAHHTEDDRLLLTASTRDLQRFVRDHLGEGELFEDHDRLVRKTNSPPATQPARQ